MPVTRQMPGQRATIGTDCVRWRSGSGLSTVLHPSWTLFLMLIACVLSPHFGWGQAITGSIVGTVSDSTGAVVPQATVIAKNTSTGVASKTISDSSGRYALPSLAPGSYTLSAEQAGFDSTVIAGISLDVYQQITVNVVLRVGGTTQTVTVQETTPQVDSSSASLGTVVSEHAIRDLPLNLRQVGALALLVPGTVDTTGRSLTSSAGNGSGFNDSSYSGSGGRSGGNLLLIDGMISRALNNGSFALNPPPEMVKEFKIQNNIYDATFGLTSGTVMNLITESGTNQLHGSAWEYLRNRDLDARNYFAITRPEYTRNQFGGAIGGPIKGNKLFFFGSYEGLRLAQGQTISSVVPTMAERAGDFSAFLTGRRANLCASSGSAAPANLNFDIGQLFDPGSEHSYTCPANPANPGAGASTVLVGTPIPGNKLSTIDSVGQKVLALYPTPNALSAANYVNQTPERRQDDQFDLRIDYAMSGKDTFFARYLFGNTNQLYPGNFSPFSTYQHFRGQNAVVAWTHVFSPSLINDVRIGYQRDYLNFSCAGCPRTPGTLASFGIASLAASSSQLEEYPNFTFTNFALWGDGLPGYFPDIVPDSIEKYEDTLSKTLGRHTITVGGDLNFWQTNGVEVPVQVNGLIGFNGQYSSLAGEIPAVSAVSDLADLELGYPSNGSYTQSPIVTHLVGGKWINVFAQDNIRFNSRLTLDLGLRWEYRGQPVDTQNKIAAFFPLSTSYRPGDALLLTALPDAANDALCSDSYFISPSGQCLVMSSTTRRAKGLTGNKIRQLSYGPGDGDFAPRIGISWRPTDSDRLIVHTGAGVFLDLNDTNLMGSYANNNPVFTRTPAYNTAFGAPPPLTNGAPTTTETMFANAPSATLSQITSQVMPSLFYHTPTVYEWSFSIQSQLTQDWALDAGYMGNRGVHLDRLHLVGNQPAPGIGDLQPRRPWPDFNNVLFDGYDAFSNYNALTMKLSKRLSNGFSGLVAYTYAKALDDSGGNTDQQSAVQDDNNPRSDYALSDFSVHHRLVISPMYQLPFGRGQRFLATGKYVNALVGGWSLTGIITFQTGFPFTVTSSQDYSNTGSASPRPDRVCNGTGPKRVTEWFDTNCFSTSALAQDLANGTPRFGKSGRDIVIGPGLQEWDASLIKRANITERLGTEFRAQFFNLFNHTNLGTPNATIGSGTAGVITSAASARDIQLGLKVTF